MGSVTNSLTGLSYLMQQGGLLSNLSSSMSADQLKSAPPQDVVKLSMAAIQTQEAEGLFGTSTSSQTTLPAMSASQSTATTTSSSTSSTDILPGVAAADLTGATSQEKAAINNQAMLLQQVQGLFAEPSSSTGSTEMLA